ncbi:FtsX-like permease family protein [bacterium]|nr:MAG: FtsX-like permease family protein [bacterium]
MFIGDLFEEIYFSIFANKVRSGLTILGIVIGVGSVVAMISIGQGTQVSIEESIQSMGSNLLMVSPGVQRGPGTQVSSGRGSAQSITIDDSEAIEQGISSIEAIAPEVSSRYQVNAKGTNTNTSVFGTVVSYTKVKNLGIDIGTFFSEQDVRISSKVAVLGPTTRDDLFGENSNPIGENIKINKISFIIIGVTKSKGGTGFGSQDDIIYIPISTAQRFLSGNDYVSTINIQVDDEKHMSVVDEQVTALLLIRHNITNPDEADFSIMNQADILETMSSVSGTLTLLLGAIAGISLIVGGIGIMNMMLTTVSERTREIGLRKSIGAKNRDISSQFLLEAIVLTFIGGTIGIIFGWITSIMITQFSDTTTSISLWSVLLAFGVSALIGIVFGYWPAKKAASLNPIDALRYE